MAAEFSNQQKRPVRSRRSVCISNPSGSPQGLTHTVFCGPRPESRRRLDSRISAPPCGSRPGPARNGPFRSATTFSDGCRKKPFGAYPGHFSLYPIVGEASPYYSGNRIHTESAASRHHSLQRGFPRDGQAVTFLLLGHIVQVCHHRQSLHHRAILPATAMWAQPVLSSPFFTVHVPI